MTNFINEFDTCPEFLYIGEKAVKFKLVEQKTKEDRFELHVACDGIFEINTRIFFGMGKDSFRSFNLASSEFYVTENYFILKGILDKQVHFPWSFLKEYCNYIDVDLYRGNKHDYSMSDADFNSYNLFKSKNIKYGLKCPHNYKINNVYYCDDPKGYIHNSMNWKMTLGQSNTECNFNCDCCDIYKETLVKPKIIVKECSNCKHSYTNKEDGSICDKRCFNKIPWELYIPELNNMNKKTIKELCKEDVENIENEFKELHDNSDESDKVYFCPCGHIEHGIEPNFCRVCGQRYSPPKPAFELTKPILLDLDPIEVKQFEALEGFGIQNKLYIKRCAKCDHSHNFDWDISKTFECEIYNDFKIDVKLAKSKQCSYHHAKNRKVCPVCNHAFDAYSESNTYASSKECPFCHKFEYIERKERSFSFWVTLFTLFAWLFPLMCAIFIHIGALVAYGLTLGLWFVVISPSDILGAFTTTEYITEWLTNDEIDIH